MYSKLIKALKQAANPTVRKKCMTFTRVLDNLRVRNPRSPPALGFTQQPSLQAVKTGHFRILYLDGETYQITSSSNSSLQPTISRSNSWFCPELDIKTVWIILEQHAWKSPAEVPYWMLSHIKTGINLIKSQGKESHKSRGSNGIWGQCHRWQGLYPTSILQTGNLSLNFKGSHP